MKSKQEIWKDIEGTDGNYKISNFGNVYSNFTKRTMCPGDNGRGYLFVFINKKRFYVHRLVALHFIDNPNNLPQVNHKDENKKNNNSDNLEWCDNSYNNKYGTLPKRKRAHMIELKGKKVSKYNLKGEVVKIYDCAKDVERDGYIRRHVDSCCRNRCKTYSGYVWRYDNDPFDYKSKFSAVAKYDISGNLIETYISIAEAQRKNNMKHKSIYGIVHGTRKNHIIDGFRYEILNKSTFTGDRFKKNQ